MSLSNCRTRGSNELPTVASIFDESVEVSQRISQYVLDRNAIKELKIDREYLPAAKQLLYGQLPVAISEWENKTLNALLDAVNEYDEPVCLRYRKVEWDELECSQALRNAKFTRDRDTWQLGGIDEPLDLSQLLANLSTYAIHETQNQIGKQTLLVSLQREEFIQLVKLLYPHNASEDAARALWKHFIGEGDLEPEKATHIGCSIAMLGRLNIRYRRQNQNFLIFRDLIAYPLRPAGKLREEERNLLYEAWRYLAIEQEHSNSISQLLHYETIDVESVVDILSKLDLTQQAKSEGYDNNVKRHEYNSSESIFSIC